MLANALPWSIGSNLAAAVLLAGALDWILDIRGAQTWFGIVAALNVARLALLYRVGRQAVVGRRPTAARRILLGGIGASGVAWGVGALWLIPEGNLSAQMLYCLFAAGMTAGAAVSYAPVRYAFGLFVGPMLAFLAIALATGNEPAGYLLTMTVAVFAFGMFGLAGSGRVQIEGALDMWVSNRRLRLDLLAAQSRERSAERRARDLYSERQAAVETAEAHSMFLAEVSHELKTPLNAVIGFSEMIANEFYGSLGNPKYREYAEDIRISSQHLRSLVDELLDLTSTTRGGRGLSLTEIVVEDVCDRVVREFVLNDASLGARLIVDVRPPGLSLTADARMFHQILRNLIDNAAKFSYPDSEILIEGKVLGADEVRLRVANRGVGIPKETLTEVVRPFVRFTPDGPGGREGPPGIGLGLALVNEFVGLHGGRLEIDSDLDIGVTVEVVLPKAGPPARRPQPPSKHEMPGAGATPD